MADPSPPLLVERRLRRGPVGLLPPEQDSSPPPLRAAVLPPGVVVRARVGDIRYGLDGFHERLEAGLQLDPLALQEEELVLELLAWLRESIPSGGCREAVQSVLCVGAN